MLKYLVCLSRSVERDGVPIRHIGPFNSDSEAMLWVIDSDLPDDIQYTTVVMWVQS